MKKAITIIGLLILFLAMSIGSFFILEYFFFKNEKMVQRYTQSPTTSRAEEVRNSDDPKQKKNKSGTRRSGSSRGADKDPEAPPGEFYMLEDIILNPLGGNSRTIIKMGMALEYNPDEGNVPEELDKRKPQILDHILDYLASQHVDSLTNITHREALRDTLYAIINGDLMENKIEDLYIIDFIRQ